MESTYELEVSEKAIPNRFTITMREQEGTLLKASDSRVLNKRRPMESIYPGISPKGLRNVGTQIL